MINMSRNFNGFGMMPYRPQRDVPDYALNKNSGGIDQYGEYLEQTYGVPAISAAQNFDQKRDDFLQNVSQQEQQTFGGGMNSFAPSTSPQPSMGRPMFSGQVIGSPFGGSVGSPSANQSLPSSPYESFFGGIGTPNFNVHTFFQEGGSVSGPPPTHGPNANGVSNRGMFKNRDSRKKLAQMGGILSSSPELQETAMTFANGGGADLPDYIINVPGLTAEGEYLRISSATLEKLNNAVPEVMANASMVSPVEMVISEGFSSLVANARPGDAVVGTRVNRLREQRAASDPSLVPMPPEIEQVSSPEDVFAASNAANDARDNRVARSIAAANNEDLTSPAQLRADPLQSKEILGDPYAGDIFSDDRIRVRPRENVGGGIEAQDAANFEKEKISAALIESLAPNNAQGQPGGILGKRYAESDDDLRMINSQRYIESLIKGNPFSGELSPSQTARNQETLRNTLGREEIAQQREDSTEAGRIIRDAADTREAFSVPLESGIAKAVPTEVNSDAERLIQAERERILKLQALNKMRKPTVTPAEELQAVTPDIAEFAKYADQYTKMRDDREVDMAVEAAERDENARIAARTEKQEALNTSEKELAERLDTEGSIFDTAGDYITEFFLNPEIQEKINSAIEQSQAATAEAVQKRVGPAIAASEDAVQALGNEAAIDAMDARNEAGPYRIAGKGFTGDGSEVDVKIEADPEGAGTVSADPLKAVVPIAKTVTEVAAAMSGLGPDVLGEDVKGVSKSVGDADQQLAEEQVSAQDSAEDLLKELSAERATNEQEQRQVEIEEEVDRKVVSPPVTPTITPAIKEKITTLGANADLGENFGGDGSIGDLTKDYVKLLKSLLGESDEDKAARKGELFMLMGAALMSGKSSNALTNIGNALQIGAKSAIQDRATRKKREDTIGLKGFEMAADRIAKRDALETTLAAEGRDEQRRLRATAAQNKERRDFETWKLSNKTYFGSAPYKAVDANFKALLKAGRDSATIDLVSGESPRDYALRKLSELFEPDNIALYLSTINALPSGADGGGGQEDSGDFKI